MNDYNCLIKHETQRAYSGYDWTWDGVFPEPLVKGRYKRGRSRHEHTLRKRFDRMEVAEYQKGDR